MTIKSIRTGWTGISALAGNEQWFSDFESIASVSVGTNAPEDIVFSNIPSTYQHLQIRGIMKSTSSAMQVAGNFNGTTPTSWWHELAGSGSGTPTSVANSGSYLGFSYCTQNDFSVMVLDILDYANTNKNKTVRSLTGYDANGSGYVFFRSALWTNTAAINEIKISKTGTNGFAQYSHFALYGIR